MLRILDEYGNPLNLTSVLLSFGSIRLFETKYIKVIVKSEEVQTLSIVISAIAHPTMQIGAASYTYQACFFSLSPSGPFTTTLPIGTLNIDESKDIYVKWAIPDSAIPGFAEYALKAEGVTT